MVLSRHLRGFCSPRSASGSAKTGDTLLRKVAVFTARLPRIQGPHSSFVAGRYILYVSYGCPWASRTLIVRKLKGLEDVIDLAVVYYHLGENGWEFRPEVEGCTPDPVYGAKTIKEIYLRADPEYALRLTVPVLFDKTLGTIVNNESSEIIRMLNTDLDEFVTDEHKGVTYYPENLRQDIDEINEWIYHKINNGVYKTGFATTQEAYDENLYPLFDALDRVEKVLEGREFLVGPGKGTLTEADIRLYTTIIRFDVGYHGAFKCNLKTIRHDYPNLHRWVRNLYWNYPAFKDTTNFDHIKGGYYALKKVNPTGVIPRGPVPHILPLDAK
ncbi:hypothetical protein PUNSTDRAFT_62356 [Punctularia strigosozonata HHB-11173 SS5]|uniref:uncharacterized protein n=1 Tax=Punctularia strigosozonata (strain HHB-11173) TaxID=741275 RepID=UPI0004416389|nr:uncharacterized protein PUNSTDRAFT_62356 [Punctularia strigosozonata HHB-11173 SS5]EIN11554.1 hypothetical protein PUNSTDRAFT_62356 [Punctularia strigosozonata HHB-11173 SS5]